VRKLLSLAVIGGLAWWFLSRRRTDVGRHVTIGYVDGSSVTLEEGSPELEKLVQIAEPLAA
jgi:hypothetical protein